MDLDVTEKYLPKTIKNKRNLVECKLVKIRKV